MKFTSLLPLLAVLLIPGCAHDECCEADARPAKRAPQATGALFDGRTLTGWAAADFAGKGKVEVANGAIQLRNGYMTGVVFTNPVPRTNYELTLDAMRVEGSDFFCGLTFPVGTNHLSFIVGGWGGGTVGLSSLDGEDASQNETTKFMNFVSGRWYHIKLRVTPAKVQAWIDNEPMADVELQDKHLSIRLEVEQCTPLGIATWNTAGALRDIQIAKLGE